MNLYFAYGANTNIDGMAYRCPAAKLVGTIALPDYRLVFRGVADIEWKQGEQVHGVLWDITEQCEKSLDRFEGFPTLYGKGYFPVKLENGDVLDVMFYKMNRGGYALPSEHYFNTIKEGYRANSLPSKALYASLSSLA